ncbi:MAG: winged helix-turn-helix domain-containing protein [Acidobacteria bacterium]|nr:winged helix-turn-helix domain-containing protein [Acidobacteriota bacterium]MCA1650925.1 winged helix-turn-helix domain-containing protein [Acidobacteriota bacterium]
MPTDSCYEFGPFRLDAARRTLCRGDEPISMTARAFDVLLALVQRPGQTVDKDELLRLVWLDTIVEEGNLTQQVFTIRRLLGPDPGQRGDYILTVPRRGYRFVAHVNARTAHSASSPYEHAAAAVVSHVVRLAMPLPGDAPFARVAERALTISPDGRTVVYVAGGAAGVRLYRRALEILEATAIPQTEGATNPFFSPDAEWIGFTAARRLQKIRAGGGPPQTICELDGDVRGATWSTSGVIVFAAGPASPLWLVEADGGTPRPLTTLRFEAGERTHRWPHMLPDGRGILFTIGHADATSFDEASLAVADLDAADHRIVLSHATDGRCPRAPSLVYGRQGTLMAMSFDPHRREVTGWPRTVVAGIAMSATGAVHAACAPTGVLVHAPGGVQVPRRWLLTLASDGSAVDRTPCEDAIEEPRVSPDGGSIIVGRRGRGSDLWLYARARRAFRRLTFDGNAFAGIWGTRSNTITCSSNSSGTADLYCLQPDRSAAPVLLVQTEFDKVAGSWSPDGATLAYTEYHPDSGADIWMFDRAAGATSALVRTRFNEYAPTISPDGRYLAYTSEESGRAEVYVVALPDGSGKCQMSTDGGAEPVWSRDGQELFYRVGRRMMRIDIRRGPYHSGVPTTLFEHHDVPGAVTGLANYDVLPEGEGFVVIVEDDVPVVGALHVTLGALDTR